MTAASIRRTLPLALAVLAGILYACALPLWEGWDEPFHFGYVQAIGTFELPVVDRTTLSQEVTSSFPLTPLPNFLHAEVPGTLSFGEWAQLPDDEKRRRRMELTTLTLALRDEKTDFRTYEAQQAPLAYAILAPLESALSGLPLVTRVLWLRGFSAVAAAMLLFLALRHVIAGFDLPGAFYGGAMVCALSSQVLWAAVSHIANDWLAIPLTVWFLALLLRVGDGSGPRMVLALGIVLGLGLLTKAYFLSLVPAFLGVMLWRLWKKSLGLQSLIAALIPPLLIAGPWYIRNLMLYGSLSGTEESIRGASLPRILLALTSIDWVRSLVSLFRASLWTGNWSFTPFPKGPINIELIMLIAGVLMCLFRFRRLTPGVRWILAACACFLAGIVYQTCANWVDSGGVHTTAVPWYGQGILISVWVAAFAGLARLRTPGRILSSALCLLASGIAATTFAVFLIPGYAGHIERPTFTLAWAWWTAHPTADLRLMAMAGPVTIYVLLSLYLLTLGLTTASAVHSLWRDKNIARHSI